MEAGDTGATIVPMTTPRLPHLVPMHLSIETIQGLIELIDAENAATKNRLVTSVLSTGDYANQAEALALASKQLQDWRTRLNHFLNEDRANVAKGVQREAVQA